MGWFNGIGWEALKEMVLPQCWEASEQNPTAGQALLNPFPNGFVPNDGGWRKGAAPRGAAPVWDHLMDGDRVRAGCSMGLREDEAAAMWPAAVNAPRLNASQDTLEPALDPGMHCPGLMLSPLVLQSQGIATATKAGCNGGHWQQGCAKLCLGLGFWG